MPDITGVNPQQPVRHPLRAVGGNEVLGWLAELLMSDPGVLTGQDARSFLLAKLDTDDLIEVRTDTPAAAADTKWFIYRSDENRLYIKTYADSTYGYTPAFSANDYQLRVIYHTGSNPNSPGVSWNAANQTFNVTSGGWGLTDVNAQWMRIVVLPALSDAASVSPAIRVGDPPASAVSYSRPNTTGLLPAAVNNVKEALDYVNDNVSTQTPAAPTSGAGLIQTIEVNRPSGGLLAVGSFIQGNFNVDTPLRNFQTNFDGTIFLEANVRLLAQISSGAQHTIRLRFEVLDASGNALSGVPAIQSSGNLSDNFARVNDTTLRISGNLPADYSGGRWRVITESNTGTADAYIDRIRIEMRPDLKSDEVILTRDDLGNNFSDSSELVTLDDALQEADAWPIQPSDAMDVAWPGGQNGIDDSGIWVIRELPLARLLQLRNQRPLHTFVGRIRYQSAYITGSRTQPKSPPPDTVDFEHRIWSNLPDGLTNTQLEARTNTLRTNIVTNQTATATVRETEVTIPADCTAITVGIRSPLGQDDARLLITDYDFDVEEGINSTGFDGNLSTDVRSLQSLAQEVDDLAVGGASTASAVSVQNSQFYNPTNVIGGLREPLPAGLSQPGLVASPTNAQQAFVKTDYLLSLAYNPYQWTQNLDYLPGGVLSEDFTVVGSGNVVSSDIDVPELFRDISEDLIVRVRVHADTEPSGFRGRLRIVTSNNNNVNVTGTDSVSINGSLSSQAQGQDIVTQQRIPAASVPSTFAIRLEGTGTNTETATFNNGHVYIEVASGDESSGQMGQAVSWNEVIIWTAGLTTTARLTNSNVQTLLAGNTWAQYLWLHFNFDNGTNDGMLFPMPVLSSQFRASAAYGTFVFSDLFGYNVIPHGTGDNQFRFIWNGAGTKGLRRIIGVSIS